jgi:hypothetical protein
MYADNREPPQRCRSGPRRVIRTLSGTNPSSLVESDLSVALVWSTIAKRSCQVDQGGGVGSITVDHLRKLLDPVRREVSFFPKPTNLLDYYFFHFMICCILVEQLACISFIPYIPHACNYCASNRISRRNKDACMAGSEVTNS